MLVNVDRLPRRESDPYDAAYANAAALHRAGVRFAIVTDDASMSRNLPYEAAMARAFGLPADAALRAITLSPAEIFGVADRMGSIEVGKDANLFVATGDVMDHRTRSPTSSSTACRSPWRRATRGCTRSSRTASSASGALLLCHAGPGRGARRARASW